MSEKRYSRHDGGQSGETSQINNHLGSMEPDELIDELADTWDAMDENDFDPDLIDACLAALDKEESVASDFDAEGSLAAFHEKHAVLLRQTAPADGSPDTIPQIGRHRRFRTARLIAAVVVVTLACMIAAQALGYNVFGVIANWTEETFHFTSSSQPEEASDNMEYESLQEALDDFGIAEPIAPAWFPSDFTLSEIKISSISDEVKFQAAYEYGGKFISITIWQYESAEAASSEAFEKDDLTVSTYKSGGVTHYLMSNNGQMKAAWINQNMACSISGNLSEEELEKMIDSIYER
ncbi:MAG: DUF4367 domain-containing protein [Bacteroidia bacterium]|nr:DUF4367 domain-containing protein [Bacteroidia bacterium]